MGSRRQYSNKILDMGNSYSLFLFFFLIFFVSCDAKKINLDVLHNYSEFLNFGIKKTHKIGDNNLENDIFKSKLEVLGEIFKENVDFFKLSGKLDIIFLVDASSSVGDKNFKSELKFIKKILSDITVDHNHTRLAVITFSSPSNTIVNLDYISKPTKEHNKCLLLNHQLLDIDYKGGETYTVGAFEKAKEIFNKMDSSRNNSKKIVFLITDGYSTGGSPILIANELKNKQITIFTIGIQNGNYKELYEVSSHPGEYYSFLLDSFEEFEGLARRALHVDLSSGDYIPLGYTEPCDMLCKEGNCCHENAICTCGTTTGHYSCICQPGYYGSGLKDDCFPCIPGTYSDGPNLCLPCPDPFHTTVAPAVGIESCNCKTGFRSDKNGNCKILKCSKITPPDHGYILKKKECSNVLNSACGIRCEIGYTLVGNSIRLCTENASWSGVDPTCEVKTCIRLPTPKNGHVECEHPDLKVKYDGDEKNYPVDTFCNFKCNEGRVLIGSTQRYCLPIAQWDGLKTMCKQIKCNKLSSIKNGRFEPPNCNSRKQEYGKKCKIICNEGFDLTGPTEKTCGKFGKWNSKFDSSVCADTTPPELDCPKNITINTLLGKKYSQTYWSMPNATDNSGLQISLWSNLRSDDISEIKFSIGLTAVTYYAQDAYGNKASCQFFVKVLDNEPPTIEECINPPPFLTTDKGGANVTWDEPYIFDNSQNVTVAQSHEFGFFQVGSTQVTYVAVDESGNKNICHMNITVEVSHCEELPRPPNGQTECIDITNGIQCVITCQEGYAIPLQQTEVTEIIDSTNFVCNHNDALWYNSDGIISPECSITKIPEVSVQEGNLSIPLENDTCTDETLLSNDVENEINDIKVTLTNEICLDNTCEIDLKAECIEEKLEEETNKILRKREIREKREVNQTTSYQELPHKNKERRRKKNKVNIKFQVRGKYVKGKVVKIKHNNSTVTCQTVKILCPPGFIPRKSRCVQCPKGTFHNVTKNKCQSCDFGFYNSEVGQISCTSCPINHSTKRMHSKSKDDCKDQCPPGTHARRKIIKSQKQNSNSVKERATLQPHCTSCPIGTYQSSYGQLRCISCPKGYTTTSVHSKDINHCIPMAEDICKSDKNFCQNGKCLVMNEYEFYCDCHTNFYGTYCDKKISQCDSQPCFNAGICSESKNGEFKCSCQANFTGRYCEEPVVTTECNMECFNGGTCVDTEENESVCLCAPGFEGDKCQKRVFHCQNVFCENNGTCVETDDNNFRCICTNGFIGRRCNIMPCDYKPCESGAICLNVIEANTTKESYRCSCPEGYTGSKCLEKINFCVELPCQNGGYCTSEETNYTCHCNTPYFGPECQFRKSTNYMLNFARYDVNDYVRLRGFQENLTAITACLWVQTLDNFNYGTLLSYATRFSDNAFTLTDYTGLVLYVNNQYIVTDVLLNDGYWHHVCAGWTSEQGYYKIYVDGKMVKNGNGLAESTNILGNGFLVIGQEQDIIGGRFSQVESFIGNMAYIDVWSRELTEKEINTHLNDCSEVIFGNLYAWPDMQDYIHGNVQILTSSFCQKCEDPKPLYNGIIDLVEGIAFYSCYNGFVLNNKMFAKGRKCTKTSKWEGFYEPYCTRVACGYPGYVKNSYSIGNRYSYYDKVTYVCDEGYNLVGNRTIVCREDGQWYPEKPKCIGIQCPSPTIKHGSFQVLTDQTTESGFSLDIGTVINITCRENATLEGESVLSCLENGTWDYKFPTCVSNNNESVLSCAINLVPSPPKNGFIKTNSLESAEKNQAQSIEYECNPGYKLFGDNVSTCITDGYWTEPIFHCIEENSCGEPKIPKEVKIIESSREKITILCPNNNTYDLDCDKNDYWTGDQPEDCVKE